MLRKKTGFVVTRVCILKANADLHAIERTTSENSHNNGLTHELP